MGHTITIIIFIGIVQKTFSLLLSAPTALRRVSAPILCFRMKIWLTMLAKSVKNNISLIIFNKPNMKHLKLTKERALAKYKSGTQAEKDFIIALYGAEHFVSAKERLTGYS